jgi:hypothetical protein
MDHTTHTDPNRQRKADRRAKLRARVERAIARARASVHKHKRHAVEPSPA